MMLDDRITFLLCCLQILSLYDQTLVQLNWNRLTPCDDKAVQQEVIFMLDVIFTYQFNQGTLIFGYSEYNFLMWYLHGSI